MAMLMDGYGAMSWRNAQVGVRFLIQIDSYTSTFNFGLFLKSVGPFHFPLLVVTLQDLFLRDLVC
jgi:hypothetical protein